MRVHGMGVEWTLDDLVRAREIPANPINTKYEPRMEVRLRETGEDWYGGFRRTTDAAKLLAQGWHDGARRLTGLCDGLQVEGARSRRRKARWSDEGDELHVERAMRGEWEQAWRTTRRVWTRGPQHIDLVTMWGGAWWLTAEQLFWQGATATVVADLLEQAGYNVRIVAAQGFASFQDDSHGVVSVVVKDYGEPARVDALAGVLCHVGIFRTHGFKLIMQLPFDVSSGLGRPNQSWEDHDSHKRMVAAGEWSDETILVGKAHSKDQAIDEIKRIIDNVG